jgi:hypothetical protein
MARPAERHDWWNAHENTEERVADIEAAEDGPGYDH